MAKLYPPMIESKLPAQVGDSLIIPFQHSRAVGTGQYKGFSLIIKNAATLTVVDTLQYELKNTAIYSPITFNITAIQQPLTPGQFYKAQLAYIDNQGTVGTYSTPGIFKYTARPNVEVSYSNNTVTATYTSTDSSEGVYSYHFDLVDTSSGDVIETSGVLLHNSQNDTIIESAEGYKLQCSDTYELQCPIEMRKEKEMELCYLTTTVNDLQWTSRYNYYLLPRTYSNIGFLDCTPLPTSGAVETVQKVDGVIYRVSPDDTITEVSGCDYTIEQGVEYEYRLVPTGENIDYYYSAKVIPDFEDMFLADETCQLCIRFNPKVASFKETIQETKMNTIGGRFPITFRNGNTKYKEFSISGLISYETDNEQLFMQESRSLYAATPSEKVAVERRFKMKVLEWLNNGKPKLFRSPTEGNYIVRLTNVSLSPNDQLGRMLHTFNAQAYEIAECTSANLKKHKVLFKGVL